MKILCLHGQGTSGAIFKSQLSRITNRLNSHLPVPIEFDYLDGPYPASPAPGIDLFYPPPYYTFWRDNTASAIRETITWLKGIIADRGPYDAVMMFSQGCALGASLLLLEEERQRQQGQDKTPGGSESKSPFACAIFICGGPPLAILPSVSYNLPASLLEADAASRAKLAEVANSETLLALGSQRWTNQAVPGGGDISTEEKIRSEMASYGDVKIRIPTVHVYGDKDPRYEASVQLSGLCEGEERRKTYNHRGGHEIPRFEAVTAKVAEMVVWGLREGGVLD